MNFEDGYARLDEGNKVYLRRGFRSTHRSMPIFDLAHGDHGHKNRRLARTLCEGLRA